MKKQQDNIYNSQNDIFLFDNLNSEGYFESGQPTSEYFNRKITITENEEYKTDNKQYKYFVKLGGGKIGGIDKDGFESDEDGKLKKIYSYAGEL